MAKSTPREQMSQIVESMNPQVRQSLTEKKIDPIIYHFRMKATKEFRLQQAQKNGQGQPQAMMGMDMPRMQTPNQNQNQNQNSGVPATQPNGTPFMNNIDQFRGQQEEGMRSQQEGQLVVPASTPTQNLPQNLNPTPEMLRRQQQAWAQQFRAQNPNASEQDMRQFVMQKYSQLQMNLQRARNQASQQSGQGQNVMQQQNRLNMLSQPGNQNPAHDSPIQNIARPQSRPQPVQMMGQGQPPQPQQGVNFQNIQQNMQRLPPQLQQVLKQSPHAQWPTIVNDWKQRQARAQAQQAFNQQQMNHAAQMQRSASQQAQNQNSQQMQNGRFPGPSPMQTSLSMGAEQNNQMPAMTPGQVQQQNLNANAQMMRMQQQQQQHQQMAQQNAMGPQKPNQDAQMQHMLLRETDNLAAPDQFRQRFAQAYAQASQNIPQLQTWQDFKNFTKAQNQPRVRLEDVMRQQLIFAQRRRQVLAAGGMPQVSQQNQPALQAPAMTQQGSNMGVQHNQQQITSQDIQAARIAHPSWNNLGDQQVRDLLATQQSRPQKSQAANIQGQSQGVNTVQAPGSARPAAQQRPGVQATQQNRPQTQNQNQAPPENKSLKRPNQDDVAEGSTTQPQNNIRAHYLNITKEQFEQMTPAEKEKYLAQRKQYETAAKVTSLTKEIFAQMKNTPRITNMDQNSRMKIINMLTDDKTKKMLARFDMFLVTFSQNESDQSFLRVLIQHRWHLMQQYTEESWKNKTYQPAEHFTLNADNLEKILKTVTLKFQQTLKNSASSRGGPQQSIPPLTKENLNMAAQQAAQLQQKSNKAAKPRDGPPPAPTGEKPPFQFPSDRAQGVPKYATPGLKPEDLKLPPKKKMRNDASASPATPVQTQQPRTLLKCPSQGCNAQGFNTQAELDFHRNQVHKPEMAPVRDPVAFLKNSVLQAFNLDENMERKTSAAGARPMEKSSSQGAETDSKGVTPGAIARGRNQQGSKDISSTTQKTHEAVQQPRGMLQPVTAFQDPWAESNFKLDDLVNAFGPTESGDIIPMATDSQALLDRTFEAYTKTDDYKRVFGDPDLASSEGSSHKSKSPDQGSELSLPTNDRTRVQKATEQDPYHVDLDMGGDLLPILEGNFDDLFVGDGVGDDWEKLDTEGSMSDWEKIEGAEDGQHQLKSGQDDFDLDSWIREPGSAGEAPFPEEDLLLMLNEPTDWEALYSSGDPSVYAGGTTAWNAVGKEGAEMRRKLGWPIEGAEGQVSKAKKQR